MMNLNEFAKGVHALAVEKGFYDPKPSDAELIAAIHSEISEAFEEWRDRRPMVWHECVLDLMCDGNGCSDGFDPNDECKYRGPEPHGIAEELIDVVLRVLDFIGGHCPKIKAIAKDVEECTRLSSLPGVRMMEMPMLVIGLHYYATMAYKYIEQGAYDCDDHINAEDMLNSIISIIFAWLRFHDIDPEALLLEKHEYNKTRPYRHSGKRV